MSTREFEWLTNDQKPYTSDDDRHALFAGKVHKRNKMEALRIAATAVKPGFIDKRCGVHGDFQNSRLIEFSSTPTWSKGVWLDGVLYRVSLIGNSRSSIDHVMEKLDSQGPYTSDAWKAYCDVEDYQKTLNQRNIQENAKAINGIPGFDCTR